MTAQATYTLHQQQQDCDLRQIRTADEEVNFDVLSDQSLRKDIMRHDYLNPAMELQDLRNNSEWHEYKQKLLNSVKTAPVL